MVYLILSDIHANMEALEAVLAAAGRYDHALVLGDLVGYGADPNDVAERRRSPRRHPRQSRQSGRAPGQRRALQPSGAVRDPMDGGGADAGQFRLAGRTAGRSGRRRRYRRDSSRRAV